MQAKFQPQRLTQARALKMLNMTELAEKAGLTRQAISQYEKGMAPSIEKLRELAKILGVSERFLTKPMSSFEQAQSGVPSFRSMASATAKARNQAKSFLDLLALLTSGVADYVQLPSVNLPDFGIADFNDLTNDDIEDLASKTRRFLGLGDGPISNMTLLLENNGVVVGNMGLNKSLDALCLWYMDRPFVLVTPKHSAVRVRFDLAHELGHLVLHKNLIELSDIEDKETLKLIENQANYFAGCFLMPETSFPAEVYGYTIDSLISVKERWGVSIAAMIMRLNHLELISESKKARLFQMMSMRNMRRNEPLDDFLEKETPRLFSKIVRLLKDAQLFSLDELIDKTGLQIEFLSKLTSIPENELLPQSRLDNVVTLKRSQV